MASAVGPPRVAIATSGTRGDVQPVVALARGLERRGCAVRVFCNVNHVALVEKLGMSATGFLPDASEVLLQEDFQEMMTTGSIRLPAGFTAQRVERLQLLSRELLIFQPELLVYTGLVAFEAYALEHWQGLCTMMLEFQPTRPVWFPMGGHAIWLSQAEDWLEDLLERCTQMADDALSVTLDAPLTLEDAKRMLHRPAMLAVSGELVRLAPDWPTPSDVSGYHITGFLSLTQQDDTEEEVRQFIASGPAPVYMGWGSMTAVSPEFMARLAVRTLLRAGKRGIVLRGWAGLTPEHLHGAEDEVELTAYARDHVKWITSAAHEILLPQCAMSVHHGGSGSTAASLRSGRPTVVTPVCLDQYYFARLVQQSGAGVRTEQLSEVTGESLAEALRRCEAPELAAAAAEIGQRLRAEDGVERAVDVIVNYVAQGVRTGQWKKTIAAADLLDSG